MKGRSLHRRITTPITVTHSDTQLPCWQLPEKPDICLPFAIQPNRQLNGLREASHHHDDEYGTQSHGKMKPVIQKALVKLDGAPFKYFTEKRDKWAIETSYVYPGPIQYFGPSEVCDQPSKTIQLEQKGKIEIQ